MEKLAVILPSRGLNPKQKYMKKWRADNKARIKASRKAYYEANKEKAIQDAKDWAINNREKDREKSKAYRKKPSSRMRKQEYDKRYYREKEKTNIQWVIKSRLRARMRRAIETNAKTGSAVKDLGCSVEEFIAHIESRFEDGMNWDNRGDWHIDHIIPLYKFDLSDREQFLKAAHYTNMQPLWAIDNWKKNRYDG